MYGYTGGYGRPRTRNAVDSRRLSDGTDGGTDRPSYCRPWYGRNGFTAVYSRQNQISLIARSCGCHVVCFMQPEVNRRQPQLSITTLGKSSASTVGICLLDLSLLLNFFSARVVLCCFDMFRARGWRRPSHLHTKPDSFSDLRSSPGPVSTFQAL
jgi:hypothetical protein